MATARYLGAWVTATLYTNDATWVDYVLDTTGDAGYGVNSYITCETTHTSTNLNSDSANWALKVGNNFYNNSTQDGGPHLTEGTLATATEVESKFDAVATGFDKIGTVAGSSLTLSASDYSPADTGRDLNESASQVLMILMRKS